MYVSSMHFEMAGPITFYLIVQIDPRGRFQVGIGYCSESFSGQQHLVITATLSNFVCIINRTFSN